MLLFFILLLDRDLYLIIGYRLYKQVIAYKINQKLFVLNKYLKQLQICQQNKIILIKKQLKNIKIMKNRINITFFVDSSFFFMNFFND